MTHEDKNKKRLLAELSSISQGANSLAELQTIARELSDMIEQLTERQATLQRQLQDLRALQAASQISGSEPDHRRVLTLVLDELCSVVPCDGAAVFRHKSDLAQFVCGTGLLDAEQLVGTTHELTQGNPLREIREHANPIVIHDTTTLNVAGWPGPFTAAGTRSWLGVPLQFAGKQVGVLALARRAPHAFAEEDQHDVLLVAPPLAAAIANAGLQEAIEHRTAELDTILESSFSLTTSLDLQHVLDALALSSIKLLHGPKDAHVFLYEQERDELSFGSAVWDGKLQHEPINRPRKSGITHTAAKSGEPVIVPDMRTHPIYADAPAHWQGAIVAIPLKIGARVIGVMNFTYAQPHTLTDDELRLLMMLSNQAAIAIENAQLYAAVQQELAEQQRAQAERERLQQEIIRIQEKTLAELSTPLFSITEDVLVMPLIGATDQQRAQRILETLLHGVEQSRARIAIMDITGIPVVDTHVASTIISAAQAARLLGAEVILTGIRPEAAETLIGLGVDFHGLRTYSDLQSGVAHALDRG